MDSLITAAGRALSAGDPIGALKRISLREDPPALALRGIAMAQLGDFPRSRALLRSAARAFGQGEEIARARCVAAEAEIALVSRDLNWSPTALHHAREALERGGDQVNAAHARIVEARRLLLVGRLDEAEAILAGLNASALPPAPRIGWRLVLAGIALRRLRSGQAAKILEDARREADLAGVPALVAEVERAAAALEEPAARLVGRGGERTLRLSDVEAILASEALVVDACRYVVRQGRRSVRLATRPVLFSLIRALAEAWPEEVSRSDLAAAFGVRQIDESSRARLRVEIGRLRTAIRPMAAVEATRTGFALALPAGRSVACFTSPVEEPHPELLALLADGESWASSALAMALGWSVRTVQRALEDLSAAGKVQSFGRGRAVRWTRAFRAGYATVLLLPAPHPQA